MYVLIETQAIEEIKAIQQEILSKLGSGREEEEDDLITVKTASKLTKMDQQTIYSMFHKGKITGRRFGKAIRVSKKALLNINK